MSSLFLILAAALSAIGLWIHLTRGRRMIVQPMLDADLHPVVAQTLVFSWNWGAVTMAVLSVAFLVPALHSEFSVLAMLATVYSYGLGALSFVTMRRHGFTVSQMPQWVLFWSASLCGVIAWGVL